MGLQALWREALLAQKVLSGQTKGYRSHPQLDRFKAAENPVRAVRQYLYHVRVEALTRGYNFKIERIHDFATLKITFEPLSIVSLGQITFEALLLKQKIDGRLGISRVPLPVYGPPRLHPCFEINSMNTSQEVWEKGVLR